MPEGTATQADEQTAAQAGSGAQGAGDTAAGQGTAPPAGKSFSQDDVDRMIADRLAREKRAADKRASELEAELAGYRDDAEKRKAAEMSEAEKAAQARAEAEARAQAAEDRLRQAEVRALRAEIISAEAADLPATYKAQVTGEDADAIRESLASVRDQHKADAADLLRRVSGMAPEDLVAQFGEDAAAPLAARLTGKPQNVGAAPRPGTVATPPDEWSPDNNTPEAWRKERERRGIGSLR